MSDKFDKLNHRFGILEFPLTFAEFKEVVLEFPKTERIFYENSFKAMKFHMKENENIHYLTVGGAKLLKPSGFVVVAESGLVLTWLKGGLSGKFQAEKIDYKYITSVDFDIIPGGPSSYGNGILILEVSGLAGGKKRKIRDIEERDLDNLVHSIRKRVPKKIARKDIRITFFGSEAGAAEKEVINNYPSSFDRLRENYLMTDEEVLITLPVTHSTSKGKQVKGILVATNQKVIFTAETIFKEITEIFDYESLQNFSLTDNIIHLESTQKKLDVVLTESNSEIEGIITEIRNIISYPNQELVESIPSGYTEERNTVSSSYSDKYQQLEQLGKLKEQGILTEEEFQNEKRKILNQGDVV